ncbi:Glutathione synthetase [Neolewinella maritima]|uniref:Glutathione synthetase n=1 Tax=Neolewinella maritima TaxID=1383882 RepID=A0ABM9AX92_9BACT|nr:glutathione synthetase [Neolewinella maritima]CAH0999074.1 Glutathione synthetase [Neolewinella maritima]
MSALSFLVLTDHSGHSDQNSVYSLVSTLAADPRCKYVDIASRGNPKNAPFFQGARTQVQGFRVKGKLQFQPSGRQFLEDTHPLDPQAYDVIWLRLPHPVSAVFFDALADYNSGADAPLCINNPEGIEVTGDKSFLLNFPEWTPPIRLVRNAEEAREYARHFPLVLKPLRAYGGNGILRVNGPEDVTGADFSTPYLAMKFLQNVSQGDKRILVVNGKILAASLRLPAPGQWLCNVAQGGKSIGAEVAPEEHAMIEAIAPELLRRGICFCGVDTLVADDGRRVLSELNTLSIGGFPQAEAQTGRPILQQTIDELFSYCYDH